MYGVTEREEKIRSIEDRERMICGEKVNTKIFLNIKFNVKKTYISIYIVLSAEDITEPPTFHLGDSYLVKEVTINTLQDTLQK